MSISSLFICGLANQTERARAISYDETSLKVSLISISFAGLKDEKRIRMKKGETRDFLISFNPFDTTDDKTITYSLSDSSVAEIDEKGTLKAIKNGTTILTATCKELKISIKIIVSTPLEDVSLSNTTGNLIYSRSDKLTYKLIPEDTNEKLNISWSSDSPDVVSVDEEGLVTANNIGTANITLNINGFKKTCRYVVILPATGINVTSSVSVNTNETYKLSPSLIPENTTESNCFTHESLNTEIATVDNEGTITGVKEGNTTIIIKHNGLRAECNVQVIYKPTSEEIANNIINFGKQFLGTTYVYGGTSLTGGVDCSSFTQQCFATQGIGLRRCSYEQVNQGIEVPLDMFQLKPGDLIFYAPGGSRISHVAIYIGDGQILHSSGSYGRIVITPYMYKEYIPCCARRYF